MSVLLRDVTEADLPILFAHQCEPEANRVAAFPSRDREAFMAHWRTRVLGDTSAIARVVVVDGEVVGHIGSWVAHDERCVGYWIGQAHWGRGVATAALTQFVATHDKTRPLAAFVAAQNAGSIRVLRKCGFREVGVETGDGGVTEIHLQLAP